MILSFLTWALLVSGLGAVAPSRAEPTTAELPAILVTGDQNRSFGVLSPLRPTVRADREQERRNVQTLGDLVRLTPGVNSQVSCANCGATRLTINGLRGEHTTILVDGVPLYSTVSSFYGMDSVPLIGIKSVEVYRGAGAAGVTPESIGGGLNLITKEAEGNGITATTSIQGTDQTPAKRTAHQMSLLGTAVSANSRTRLVLGLDQAQREFWDVDDNNVAEFPTRANRSFFAKGSYRLTSKDEVSFRYAQNSLRILGGTTTGFTPSAYPNAAVGSDFRGGDVREAFIGNPARITDFVRLQRFEYVPRWQHEFSEDLDMTVTGAWTLQRQDSIYSHGYDYNNRNDVSFQEVKFNWLKGAHVFNFGAQRRLERLGTSSQALFVDRSPPLASDSLRLTSHSLFFEDNFQWSEAWTLVTSLRADDLRVDWYNMGHELHKQLLSPRMRLEHKIGEHWSWGLSYGRGYRAPLTLFESEHGTDHDGFLVEIDRIETSDSAVFTVSHNTPKGYVTPSLHFTRLNDLAYATEKGAAGDPIVFRNAADPYDIWIYDLLWGYKLNDRWMLEGSFERFEYEDGYKLKLPVAAIEQRAQLKLEYARKTWSTFARAEWVGARNLRPYGYDNHYNRIDPDPLSPTFGEVSERKRQRAPDYVLLDVGIGAQLTRQVKLTAGINNLTGYTQAGAGDSPATWHWHGTHAHYDNFHIWGPLTGREFFVRLESSIGDWL